MSGKNSRHSFACCLRALTMRLSCLHAGSGCLASIQQYDMDNIGSTAAATCAGAAVCMARRAAMSAKASGGRSCRRGSGFLDAARSTSQLKERRLTSPDSASANGVSGEV